MIILTNPITNKLRVYDQNQSNIKLERLQFSNY